MYFFYIDESGSRDPQITGTRKDGSTFTKDHLYVLTAVGLYERRWHHFERAIANLKLELIGDIRRVHHVTLNLSHCEVKSTWLRIPKERDASSQFLRLLSDTQRMRIVGTYYQQIQDQNIILFSVVVDKRRLRDHVTPELLHKKAYELLLERIEHYLAEFHPNHQGLIVIDDTQRQLNRAVAMKHAFFQREGNANLRFHHIVEYPFFTESTLSNGIQLADLCGYNVYRAFRNLDFSYSFFEALIPAIYSSNQTLLSKLDGLKVFPDDSELIDFARDGFAVFQKKGRPAL
jgi:hypothetical protein